MEDCSGVSEIVTFVLRCFWLLGSFSSWRMIGWSLCAAVLSHVVGVHSLFCALDGAVSVFLYCFCFDFVTVKIVLLCTSTMCWVLV